MIKKALIYSAVNEWINLNNIPRDKKGIQIIFNRAQELYMYLKNHPDFPNLFPDNLLFQDFFFQMQEGLKIATDPQYAIFREMM